MKTSPPSILQKNLLSKSPALLGLRINLPINSHYFMTWKPWTSFKYILFTQSVVCDSNAIWVHNHWVSKRTLNPWAVLWVLICTVYLTVCCYCVTCEFQTESTLYSCCHLNFRYRACFEQGVPWHRVWIHSETCTWHDSSIQPNAPYR